MMIITNKEVIDQLQDYFLKQDPKDVARLLANMMIDMHRVATVCSLPEDEQESLSTRIQINSSTLQEFVENGFKGDFSFGPL